MTPFQIYIWQQLDTFRHTLGSISVLLIVVSVLFLVIMALAHCLEEEVSFGKKTIVSVASVLILGFFLWLFSAILPSSKTLAMMYIIPKLTKNQSIQNLPPKMVEAATLGLDSLIKLEKSYVKKEGK